MAAVPQTVPAKRDSQVLFNEAESAYQHGDAERAIQLYKKLLSIQPESVPARANLAVALAAVGRYDDAITQYKIALNRSPDHPGLLLNMALARYKQADFGGAARDLERVRSQQPGCLRQQLGTST